MNNESKRKGRIPDYKGNGVAVWVNQTLEGDSYLSIRMIGHNQIVVFKNKEESHGA